MVWKVKKLRFEWEQMGAATTDSDSAFEGVARREISESTNKG